MRLLSDAFRAGAKVEKWQKDDYAIKALEYLKKYPDTKYRNELIGVIAKSPDCAKIMYNNKDLFGFKSDADILYYTQNENRVCEYLKLAGNIDNKQPFIEYITNSLKSKKLSTILDCAQVLARGNDKISMQIQDYLVNRKTGFTNIDATRDLCIDLFDENYRQLFAEKILDMAEKTCPETVSGEILRSLISRYHNILDFDSIFNQSLNNYRWLNCLRILQSDKVGEQVSEQSKQEMYAKYAEDIKYQITQIKELGLARDAKEFAFHLSYNCDLFSFINAGICNQGEINSTLSLNLPKEVLAYIVLRDVKALKLQPHVAREVQDEILQNAGFEDLYKFASMYNNCDKPQFLKKMNAIYFDMAINGSTIYNKGRMIEYAQMIQDLKEQMLLHKTSQNNNENASDLDKKQD